MGFNNTTDMNTSASKFAAYVIVVLSYLIGGGSLLVWLVFLFYGSLNLVNFGMDETAKLLLNACLCIAFFIQHSTMIRKSFKSWIAKFIRVDFFGALYTISSGVLLLALVILWQKSAYSLVASQGIIRWLFYAVFFMSIVGFNWGTRSLGSFDGFGTKPILNCLHNADPPRPTPFTVRGPYRWVRHPLYTFTLLMIWSCPDLTLDRLLHNILWTFWIIIGSILEERDLVASHGNKYRNYQSNVPMLIPRTISPAL